MEVTLDCEVWNVVEFEARDNKRGRAFADSKKKSPYSKKRRSRINENMAAKLL